MRVLHVAAPGPVGGLEQVLVALASAQRSVGNEVHVATLSGSPVVRPLLDRLDRRDVITHTVISGERDYWGQRDELARLAADLRPDVVHTHGYRADVLSAAACDRAGAAAVTTLHGFTGGDLKNRCYEWLQRRSIRNYDGVVAVSTAMADRLTRKGLPPDRVHVIPNVLPPPGPRLFRGAARRCLGVASDRWVIGWVGRLSHEKGLDILLEALARTPDRNIDLVVLGDGPERRRLEHFAELLGVNGRVRWCGMVAGADRFFSAFDLLVLSSRTEGCPIVLLEAMSACIPIIATAVGGIPETVTPATALLVPPEEPEALASAIANVRHDPGAAARRSLRAHVRSSRRSDPTRWVASYADVYRAAVGRRRARM